MSQQSPFMLGFAIKSLLWRELRLMSRQLSEVFNPLLFFLMVVVFIALGISADKNVLSKLAPGMIWVMALLATLLSLDGLFKSDYDDGTLEQLMVSPLPMVWLVLVKVLAHWLFTGLPLTLLAPVLGVMLFLPVQAFGVLMLSLALGTACLSCVGAIGAALTVSLRRGGLVLSLIVMPLYSPILIFGADSVNAAAQGLPFILPIVILTIYLLAALITTPFATAGALKISLTS